MPNRFIELLRSSQGDKESRRRFWRIALIAAAVLSVCFCVYLGSLYFQLRDSFETQKHFIPTRIYSDVTRIAPAQTRGQTLDRLRSLGYKTENSGEKIEFKLHSPDYPSYLIPDGHPSLSAGGESVVLHMDSSHKDSLIQSIDVGGQEISDLYLEPELVATLSRGGALGDNQIRAIVKLDDIPAPLWKAIIATEDVHFMDHVGLDPRGIVRAIWIDLKTASLSQGGSTITLQLVKNLTARKTKNLFKKVNEAFLAILLELTYDKDAILERYLNEVDLGQVGNFEIHGVAEGAEHFYGKKLEDLNLGEIALMAGLIKSASYYSPYKHLDRALERQKLVLRRMVETGQIAEGEAKAALQAPIRLAPPQTVMNKAPYFTDFVKAELIRQLKDKVPEAEIPQASFRVYTTLDMGLAPLAQKAVADGMTELEKRYKLTVPTFEGALAAVDHSTGFVRALVGGRSYARSTFNRILNMKRQVGSTFKPVVYLSAFIKGYDPEGVAYGPGHPAFDGPWKLTYDRGKKNWSPHNYEKEFMGWTSYRSALAHSVNTIAARVGYEVGIPNVITTARALGIQSDLPNVPSLSLGVAELSPVELLRAYAVMANHGVQDELTVIRGISNEDGTAYARFVYNPKQVIDVGPADLITQMMESVFTDGTAAPASAMGFDRRAAGKTGTTSNHRDAWFAGYTPQLTAVVWVGMDQTPAAIQKPIALSGAGSALPIWVRFMKGAHLGEAPTQFPISAALVDVAIDQHTGLQASPGCPLSQVFTEKYVRGLEPRAFSCEPGYAAAPGETTGP